MSSKIPDRHLDLIYNRIVPAPYRSELKSVGILGGLSIGVCLILYLFLSSPFPSPPSSSLLAMSLQPTNVHQVRKKIKRTLTKL